MGYSTHRDPDGTVWVRNPDGTWMDPKAGAIQKSEYRGATPAIREEPNFLKVRDRPILHVRTEAESDIALALRRTELAMLWAEPKKLKPITPTEDWRKPGTHRVKPRRPEYKGHFL